MLFYEKRGEGQVVVLLHGLPCNHTIWDPLTSALKGKFTFILPDFPGAGRSPEHKPGLTLKDVAKEVATILEQEKISKAIIAGHSMGGYTALSFAAMFPEQTKAVTLIHSSSAADTGEKKQNRIKSIALIRKGEDAKQTFVKALIHNLFDTGFAKANPEAIQAATHTGNQLSANTLIQWYEALMKREDTTHLLYQGQFPIQWILGEQDMATLLQPTLKLAHIAAFNDICIYPNCGHMSMVEKPEKLQKDVERFWSFVSRH